MVEHRVALALALVCGCNREPAESPKVVASPGGAEAAKPEDSPGPLPLPTGDPAFELRVGPVVSATDPRLLDDLDRVPLGHVGIAFRRVGAGTFAAAEIEIVLAMLDGGGTQHEIDRKAAKLSTDDDVFLMAWKLAQPGTYQVVVADPKRGTTLAARRFAVASDAAASRNRVPVEPPFELNVGPAMSPDDPKPSKTATVLPLGYVGLRFAPPLGQRFTTPLAEITLWKVEGERRVLAARTVETIVPTHEVLYKAWELTATGIYDVEVADPDSDALFATTRFEVVAATP